VWGEILHAPVALVDSATTHFLRPSLQMTFAEMTPELKHVVSHRGQAFKPYSPATNFRAWILAQSKSLYRFQILFPVRIGLLARWEMKILPSPISPVRAAAITVNHHINLIILNYFNFEFCRNSTVYSEPR